MNRSAGEYGDQSSCGSTRGERYELSMKKSSGTSGTAKSTRRTVRLHGRRTRNATPVTNVSIGEQSDLHAFRPLSSTHGGLANERYTDLALLSCGVTDRPARARRSGIRTPIIRDEPAFIAAATRARRFTARLWS